MVHRFVIALYILGMEKRFVCIDFVALISLLCHLDVPDMCLLRLLRVSGLGTKEFRREPSVLSVWRHCLL